MKVTSLTKEQKEKLPIYRDMYLDKFFKNDKVASKQEVKEYIHWFYSTFNVSKNKKPKVILVNSPYEVLVAISFIKAILAKRNKVIGNEVGNEVRNEVRNEVWNEVSNEVWNEVRNEVMNEVWNEVLNEVWNEVGNEVWNEVLNEVRNEVGNEVLNEVRNEVRNEVWNEVGNEVVNEVENEVWNEVRNEVRNEVENEVGNEVGNEVENEVWNEVRNEVVNEVGNEVRNEVWNEVGNEVGNEVLNEVLNEVRNEVRNEVWNEVRNEVSNEVWNEVRNEVENEVSNEVWNEVVNEVRNEVWNEVGNEVGNEVLNEVLNEVRNEVWNEVRNEVRNEVSNEVWNEVSNEVGNEVLNEVRNEVEYEVRNEVLNEVWNEVGNEVLNEVENDKIKWYSPDYYLSSFNSWVSFYDFFDKECFKLKKSFIFNQYKKVLDLNIFWSVSFQNFVFVSRNATVFNRDNQKKLHSVFGKAIEFGGKLKYGLYFIHGVPISKNLFYKLCNKLYTFQDWVKEKNEEVKSAILSFFEERYGSEYLFRFISDNLKEVDTFVDKKDKKYLEGTTGGMNIGVYTLFKGELNGISLAFVRCYCPSTDRMFFLCVDSVNKTAKDAIASLYRVPQKLVSEIKYIQRQGERFSTIFTDNGKAKLSKMTKEEIADLVSISGDQYFSQLKYEY